jgi:oligoribonuclease (3'-5' exoribonuclease)
MSSKLVFVDTETTGLNRDWHEVWDIAIIVRDPSISPQDIEHQWFIPFNFLHLRDADQIALKINKFYERHPEMVRGNEAFALHPSPNEPPLPRIPRNPIYAQKVALEIVQATRDAHFVGNVPDFDQHFITKFLKQWNFTPTWHYHLICVENLIAGATGSEPPWESEFLSKAVGVEPPVTSKHEALTDARWARDMYDAWRSLGDSK